MQIYAETCRTGFIKQLKNFFRPYYRGQTMEMGGSENALLKKNFCMTKYDKIYFGCVLVNGLHKPKVRWDTIQCNYKNFYCMLIKYTNGLIDHV